VSAMGGTQVSEAVLPAKAKGAVVDMDGTLLDSNELRVGSWQAACERHGLTIDKDKYMKETGRSGKDIVDSLCKEQGKDLSEDERKELVEDEGKIFKKHKLPAADLVPVVLDIVKAAKERGLKMAVASGGQHDVVEKILKDHGIDDMFDVVVTSKDVENCKPAPDIFLLAADKLGVKPEECVAYEDAEQGIKSAAAAQFLKVVDVTKLDGHPEKEEKHGD